MTTLDIKDEQISDEAKAEVEEVRKRITEVKRVHVATPAYDGKVDSDYASSMLMAGQLCSLQLVECSAAVVGNGAFIEIARNVLVKDFLKSERLKSFTHFMFIDSDLWFEPRAIAGLVRSGLPVTCGIYRRRQENVSYPVRLLGDNANQDRSMETIVERDGWIRCDRVPTGFLCLEREVLEEMTRRAIAKEFPYDNPDRPWPSVVDLPDQGPVPWLFWTGSDDGERFVGEDFSFCDDYMSLWREGVFDEPIWAWPDFDFRHGGYDCNWQHHLAEQVGKHNPQPKKRRLGKRKRA
jgi:hypothetical protein